MANLVHWLGNSALPILLAIWFVLFAVTVKLTRRRGKTVLSDRRAGPALFAVGMVLVVFGVFAVLFAQPQTVGDMSLLDMN